MKPTPVGTSTGKRPKQRPGLVGRTSRPSGRVRCCVPACSWPRRRRGRWPPNPTRAGRRDVPLAVDGHRRDRRRARLARSCGRAPSASTGPCRRSRHRACCNPIITLLTYFSHHGGRRRSLLDIAATLRDRGRCGTPGSGPPALAPRRACPSVSRPARFINSTPVGTAAGNARSTGRASSGASSTIRTRSERLPWVSVTSPAARTLLTQSAPGIAVHDIALAVDVHRRDRRRAWLARSCGPARSAPPAPRTREIGRPSAQHDHQHLVHRLEPPRWPDALAVGHGPTLLPYSVMP